MFIIINNLLYADKGKGRDHHKWIIKVLNMNINYFV